MVYGIFEIFSQKVFQDNPNDIFASNQTINGKQYIISWCVDVKKNHK